MTRERLHLKHWLGAIAAASLAACGGSDGAVDTPLGPITPITPSTVRISGSAVDGPLQGATACYDLNDNGACDSGEPVSTATDADGKFSLDVATADAGKHRLVVEVPASAIDKDTGAAVGTAFKLQVPASGQAGAQTLFASPLSTLVQAHADGTGATIADAVAFVQTQAALAVSPLADFTATASADNSQARLVARVVQLTLLAQADALKAAVGSADISGATITKADLDAVVAAAVIGALPTVAALVADSAVSGATGVALTDALKAAAATSAAATGLNTATAAAVVGSAKLPGDPDAAAGSAATAGASLAALRYTDENNWFYRSFESSAADNTPDAARKLRYYSVYRQSQSSGFSAAGTVNAWGFGGSQERSGDLHWNGTAWAACPLFTRNSSTVRDSKGRSSYEYCDGFELGLSARSTVDLAGKSIATVFADTIRKFPGGANGVAFADWGPKDLTRFGSATFPAGSKLIYQTNTPIKSALAYDVQPSNQVSAYSAAIAAGGDARSTANLACAAASVTATPVTTLENVVALNPGKPCVFGKNVSGSDSSLDPNEWWSNSTVSLGLISGGASAPAGTGNWYGSDLRLRVAFAASGSATTYYSCLSRASNGSSRNCSRIGSGSYAIQTLGDARVMSFTGLPALTQKTGYTRVFVERGGQVFYGYRNVSGIAATTLRLNLDAANAVFKMLGIGALQPTTRAADLTATDAAAMAAVKGAWGVANDSSALVFRFADGGRFLLGHADPAIATTREQTGGELGWYSYDAANKKLATLIEVDSDLTAGTSHPQPGDTLTLAADKITVDNGTELSRLTDSGTGIVGLWARGSATELKTQHFAFFANGRVLVIDPLGDTSGGACQAARQGPPGGEFASYTYNAAAGSLRIFGKQVDTDGCAGVFDSSAGAAAGGTAYTELTLKVVIAADGQTASVFDGSTNVTLYRIAVK